MHIENAIHRPMGFKNVRKMSKQYDELIIEIGFVFSHSRVKGVLQNEVFEKILSQIKIVSFLPDRK